MSKNYVNNAEFYEAIVEYKKACREAEDQGLEEPRIPNYIGECIYDIATRLSYKGNFVNYPFREELIGDGVENAIAVLKNFDPDKGKNPFSYFTQIIWFAFIRRIQKEKKHLYIKHKVIENSVITGDAFIDADHGGEHTESGIDLNNEYMNDFVKNFEESMEKKRTPKKKKKKGLEKYYDEEEQENVESTNTSSD